MKMLMTPEEFDRGPLAKALELLPDQMGGLEPRVLLTATALQESGLVSRWQIVNGGGKGPARGLLQFEYGSKLTRGGVWGVYLHHASSEPLRLLCRAVDVRFEPRAIWAELEHNDILAAGVGRLLYWTDPFRLPELGQVPLAWNYYLRNWRPGKPHQKRWAGNYARALEAVTKEKAYETAAES